VHTCEEQRVEKSLETKGDNPIGWSVVCLNNPFTELLFNISDILEVSNNQL
jgi:hypothetical protein